VSSSAYYLRHQSVESYRTVDVTADNIQTAHLVTGPEFTSPFSSEQKAPEQPPTEGSPQVRFASANEEIAPNDGFTGLQDTTTPKATPGEDQAGLGNLSVSLQGTQLQERRMSRFAFEPISLPASRVCRILLKLRFLPELCYTRCSKSTSKAPALLTNKLCIHLDNICHRSHHA
jgi:hypothetical protein